MIDRIVRRIDLSFVFLFTIFLIYLVYAPLTDFDYFWHLKTGEYLVMTGSLPETDIFSYTNPDKPWVLHEWLFEVILYTLHSLFGDIGVKLLTALSIVTTIGLTHKTISTYISTNKFTLILTAVLLAMTLTTSARPQLVSYVLLSTFLYILSLHRRDNMHMAIWLLPPLMVVWVNSHGGYIVGVVVLALYAISEYIQARWFEKKAGSTEFLKSIAPASILTILATLLNPYHIEHWVYPFTVVAMQANDLILEWKPPSYKVLHEKFFFIIAFLYIFTLFPQKQVRIGAYLLPFFFIANAFQSIRHIAIAGIVTTPFLITNLAIFKDRLSAMLNGFTGKFRREQGSNKGMGIAENYANIVLICILCGLFYLLYQGNKADELLKLSERLPVEATDYLEGKEFGGNLFNTYRYGGYLIYKRFPAHKVFIDGRADMYGDNFIQEYMQIINGMPQWKSLLDKYNVETVLCEISAPLHQLLMMDSAYTKVYEDDINAVFRKNMPLVQEQAL